MEYNEFLFLQLWELYQPDKELEYNLLFGEFKIAYNEFENSSYNNEYETLYMCIINFLKDKYK